MSDTRMRTASETRMAMEGQSNAGGQRRLDDEGNAYYDPAPLSQYPRMLYRKTETSLTQEWADAIGDLKDKPMVINEYDGLLCDTCIATSATEAEALAEVGWDITPHAAHGITTGLVAATSAKDEEIASLRAQLAAQTTANGGEPVRRGPGRPPKQPEA